MLPENIMDNEAIERAMSLFDAQYDTALTQGMVDKDGALHAAVEQLRSRYSAAESERMITGATQTLQYANMEVGNGKNAVLYESASNSLMQEFNRMDAPGIENLDDVTGYYGDSDFDMSALTQEPPIDTEKAINSNTRDGVMDEKDMDRFTALIDKAEDEGKITPQESAELREQAAQAFAIGGEEGDKMLNDFMDGFQKAISDQSLSTQELASQVETLSKKLQQDVGAKRPSISNFALTHVHAYSRMASSAPNIVDRPEVIMQMGGELAESTVKSIKFFLDMHKYHAALLKKQMALDKAQEALTPKQELIKVLTQMQEQVKEMQEPFPTMEFNGHQVTVEPFTTKNGSIGGRIDVDGEKYYRADWAVEACNTERDVEVFVSPVREVTQERTAEQIAEEARKAAEHAAMEEEAITNAAMAAGTLTAAEEMQKKQRQASLQMTAPTGTSAKELEQAAETAGGAAAMKTVQDGVKQTATRTTEKGIAKTAEQGAKVAQKGAEKTAKAGMKAMSKSNWVTAALSTAKDVLAAAGKQGQKVVGIDRA